MTEYTPILQSTLETGDPWTATQAQAAIFNPVAIAEQDQTTRDNGVYAPGAWFSEDGTDNAGTLYDFGTDGNVASIETPTFEAGWDYLIVVDMLSATGGAGDPSNLELALYAQTTGSYVSVSTTDMSITSAGRLGAQILIRNPYKTANFHLVECSYYYGSGGAVNGVLDASTFRRFVNRTTAQPLSKARLRASGGQQFDFGSINLLKRKGQAY